MLAAAHPGSSVALRTRCGSSKRHLTSSRASPSISNGCTSPLLRRRRARVALSPSPAPGRASLTLCVCLICIWRSCAPCTPSTLVSRAHRQQSHRPPTTAPCVSRAVSSVLVGASPVLAAPPPTCSPCSSSSLAPWCTCRRTRPVASRSARPWRGWPPASRAPRAQRRRLYPYR